MNSNTKLNWTPLLDAIEEDKVKLELRWTADTRTLRSSARLA
jgi:hypothetical protein